jgi:signal transduction histidine kinase
VDASASRIARLEEELARAQAELAQARSSLARGSVAQPAAPVADAADAEQKSAALEEANRELRLLTQNLDQIVRQRTRALAESEAQLRRKNAELDRLNRMKSDFIAIAAHELRTPMTSVVGYLDLIVEGRMGELPSDLRRPVAALRRNAHRLKRLVDDMLDASRLETGRVSLHRSAVSLPEILTGVLDELRPLAAAKRQSLELHAAEIPPIDGDADKVHQIVCNLVANSVKYTAEGGEIRLYADVHAGQARLRVWDNGIGIPVAQRERIFEPFSDVNTAKHHTSNAPDSAGLGLYIARALVELHGGTIAVDSEEGRYCEFTVSLPLAR